MSTLVLYVHEDFLFFLSLYVLHFLEVLVSQVLHYMFVQYSILNLIICR